MTIINRMTNTVNVHGTEVTLLRFLYAFADMDPILKEHLDHGARNAKMISWKITEWNNRVDRTVDSMSLSRKSSKEGGGDATHNHSRWSKLTATQTKPEQLERPLANMSWTCWKKHNCRGQACDGATAMSSALQGVAAIVSS